MIQRQSNAAALSIECRMRSRGATVPPRGSDTSMAGMAIAIPGVLNMSETGDTMGKIRWHRGNGQKTEKMAKKTYQMGKKIRFLHPCHPYQSGAMPPLAPGAPSPARATLLIITFLLAVSAWSLLLLLLEAEQCQATLRLDTFLLKP